MQIDNARLSHIRCCAAHYDAWRDIKDEAGDIRYPYMSAPGVSWPWEIAVGTNPKVVGLDNIRNLSSGSFEWERLVVCRHLHLMFCRRP